MSRTPVLCESLLGIPPLCSIDLTAPMTGGDNVWRWSLIEAVVSRKGIGGASPSGMLETIRKSAERQKGA